MKSKETEFEEEFSIKEIPKDSSEETINIMFRYNRLFELHIGRVIYRFEGRETKPVPASILTHSDWTKQTAKKFVIKREA